MDSQIHGLPWHPVATKYINCSEKNTALANFIKMPKLEQNWEYTEHIMNKIETFIFVKWEKLLSPYSLFGFDFFKSAFVL